MKAIQIKIITMKTFRLFATILMVAICAGFTSCNNDDEDGNNSKRLVSGTAKEGDGQYSFTLEYDALGRVIKQRDIDLDGSYTYEYIYSDAKITVNIEDIYNQKLYTDQITYYLKDGLIISNSDGYQYLYDAENRLIQCKDKDDTVDYVWKDGNIVSSSEVYSGSTYTNTYSYTNIPYHHLAYCLLEASEMMGIDSNLWGQGFFGKCIKNLVETAGAEDDKCLYKYELDKDGYITKITETSGEGKTNVVQLTWQ